MSDGETYHTVVPEFESPPNKRRKLSTPPTPDTTVDATIMETRTTAMEGVVVKGLNRPISPPSSRRRQSRTPELSLQQAEEQHLQSQHTSVQLSSKDGKLKKNSLHFISSPIQLTRIKDFSPAQNIDTITLHDILGDPMIKECWNFNYLFDIDFVMQHIDADVRNLIKLKIIHGFWKKDDERRIRLQEAAEQYTNVELISAYMPDPFGTHHSKMLVLFRHDDFAQVIIHTANMIARDWGNMTQAVWRSPLLPLQNPATSPTTRQIKHAAQPVGSGERFQSDLLRYLNAYGKRLTGLIKDIVKYDFSTIQAAFLGCAPSRQKLGAAKPKTQTSWGWLGLREILSSIPTDPLANDEKGKPHIVIQVSSIATLGQTSAWLTHFQSVLSSHSFSVAPTCSSSLQTKANFFDKREPKSKGHPDPKLNLIFPTAHEIRTSLDGYSSGFSIHMKLQSPAQQKQLQYLRPLLCHWNHQDDLKNGKEGQCRKAERGSAAPHIKTYIRFSDETQKRIDWAMVTSANLSKQAWGELENKGGEVWIQSWECGVVVWPALFSSSFAAPSSGVEEAVELVPVFGKDTPDQDQLREGGQMEEESEAMGEKLEEGKVRRVIVGLRMPYDLPLEPYKKDEVPWCASAEHTEPDWKGQTWGRYHSHR